MNVTKSGLVLVLIACGVGLLFSCQSPKWEAPQNIKKDLSIFDVMGKWMGLCYQYDLDEEYAMVLEIKPTDNKEFDVICRWPTLRDSVTEGKGILLNDRLTWTERKLLEGEDITLDCRYTAVITSDGKLAGAYVSRDTQEENGSFSLEKKDK